jgi:hypothetical protein
LEKNDHGKLIGMLRGEIGLTPLQEVASHTKTLDVRLLDVARILAR